MSHHSVKKWKIYFHRTNISSNQLFSNSLAFSKSIAFTKFLPKNGEREQKISAISTHCANVIELWWFRGKIREFNYQWIELEQSVSRSPLIIFTKSFEGREGSIFRLIRRFTKILKVIWRKFRRYESFVNSQLNV